MFCVLAQNISISGIVTDPSNNPVSSAIVRIDNLSLLDTTNEKGVYIISKLISKVSSSLKTKVYSSSYIFGNSIVFKTIKAGAPVRITIYNSFGKQVTSHSYTVSTPGLQTRPLFITKTPAHGVYLVRVNVAGESHIHKILLSGKKSICQSGNALGSYQNLMIATTEHSTAVDTMSVSATGYITKIIPLESYTLNSVHVTLEPINTDTTPPVLTILGANPMDIILGDSYVEHGATAIDNMDGDLSNEILINDNINNYVPGSYATVYIVYDVAGNIAKAQRIVNIIEGNKDTISPVITILGSNPMSIANGSSYIEPGATALDNKDGDLTGAIEISGTVNSQIPGEYKIFYRVSDQAGNQSEKKRTVIVGKVDNQPPVLTLVGYNPIYFRKDSSYIEYGATAFDSIDGDFTSEINVNNSNINMSVWGLYEVVYSVTDSKGNNTTKKRKVRVDRIRVLRESDNNNTIYGNRSHSVFKLPIKTSGTFKIEIIHGAGSYSIYEGQVNQIISNTPISVTPDRDCVCIRITTNDKVRIRFNW